MRRFLPLVVLAAVAGCGGLGGNREDYVVDAAVSPQALMASLSAVSVHQSEAVFGKLGMTTTRPEGGGIVWTFPTSECPGHKGEKGEIALRLEPVKGGKATRVHVAIFMPTVPVRMGESGMVLSEDKLETEFKKLIESLAKHAGAGSSTDQDVSELSSMMTAISIMADFSQQAKANELKRNPDSFANIFEGEADQGDADAPEPVSADEESEDPA